MNMYGKSIAMSREAGGQGSLFRLAFRAVRCGCNRYIMTREISCKYCALDWLLRYCRSITWSETKHTPHFCVKQPLVVGVVTVVQGCSERSLAESYILFVPPVCRGCRNAHACTVVRRQKARVEASIVSPQVGLPQISRRPIS